jgi:hypothetical protein
MSKTVLGGTEDYAVFGEFINTFANTESWLQSLLRKLTGMSDAAARIMCGGMRNSDLVSRLRGLSKIADIEDSQKNRIERILDQFLVIGQTRDKLVHRHGFVVQGATISMDANSRTMPESGELTYFLFPMHVLRDAISDLSQMSYELQLIAIGRDRLKAIHVVAGFSDLGSEWNQFESYTWRYKSPAPAILDRTDLPDPPQ